MGIPHYPVGRLVVATTNIAVLDQDFELFGESSLDERKRITLTRAVDALHDLFHEEPSKIRFAIYVNKAGQILLSPKTTIPLHEAWLFKNPDALHSVLRGLEQAKAGKVREIGSFAQYAEDEID